MVSRGFAILFGVIGLLQFNFILILIAFFISGMAQSELLIAQGTSLLKNIRAEEAMTEMPPIESDHSIAEAAERMLKERRLLLPVEHDGNFLGVISFQMLQSIPKERWTSSPISEAKPSPVPTLERTDPIGAVFEKGLASGAIAVVRGTQFLGLIFSKDLMNLIQVKSALPNG